MVAVRALQRRVVKLEQVGKPKPSPLVRWYGSFENYVSKAIVPGVRAGALAERDIYDIVEALHRWETDGTWDRR